MTRLSSYILLFLLIGCITTQTKTATIFGVSGVQKEMVGSTYQYSYYVHFSPNIERYTVSYMVGWKVLYTSGGNIPDKGAKRSIGIQEGFEITEDVPVTLKIRAYVKISESTWNSLVYEYELQ